MAFSYSGDPRKSTKDKVRFLIGDTDANSAQLQDAEIYYLIESEGTALAAAIAGALALMAKFSRLMDESVGDVSKSYSQRADHYKELAKQLRTRNSEKSVFPYAGGISENDKLTNENNQDAVKPAFTRELHNNPLSKDINDQDEYKY